MESTTIFPEVSTRSKLLETTGKGYPPRGRMHKYSSAASLKAAAPHKLRRSQGKSGRYYQ
jgi:hypothetical protein